MRFFGLFEPCTGDCALAIYTGSYVEDAMRKILIDEPAFPTSWDFSSSDRLVAFTLSRRVATILSRIDIEPEVGFGRRFGRQEGVLELWGAVYGRYRGFPWDDWLTTTIALSTGLNWASEISDIEAERSNDTGGYKWHHFFSPEVTFALPSRPDVELLFRLHHRSGGYGLINDAGGASQYGTVGLRWRF